jgi:hypothetical protein
MRIATYFTTFALLLLTAASVEAFVGHGAFAVKSAPLHMTILTYGNKKKNFKPGSPMKSAVAQLGIKPTYSCKK